MEPIEHNGKKYHYASGYFMNGNHSLHRTIWEEANGEIPEGMLIHHIDKNSLNNSLDNLEMITVREHRIIHKHATVVPSTKFFIGICALCGSMFYARKYGKHTCSKDCTMIASNIKREFHLLQMGLHNGQIPRRDWVSNFNSVQEITDYIENKIKNDYDFYDSRLTLISRGEDV
jgi:hypothetical protein